MLFAAQLVCIDYAARCCQCTSTVPHVTQHGVQAATQQLQMIVPRAETAQMYTRVYLYVLKDALPTR
jgi:hypothetical protein